MYYNMKEIVISVRNLTKTYSLYSNTSDRLKEVLFPWRIRHTLFYALNDVSFDLYDGEHLGIIGVNGSGKSTLLQTLSGVLAPTSGSIVCNGTTAALLELGAGLNPELTGRENIAFMMEINGTQKESVDRVVREVIFFADIGQFIDQPVKWYSSGMFVRLAFAMNITVDPDILIIDEALSVGDVFFQQKCIRRMREYREKGTIIFVSHDIATVGNLCTRTLWLEGGRVREYGFSKEVCAHYLASLHEGVGRQYEAIPAAKGREANESAFARSGSSKIAGDNRLKMLRLNPEGRFDNHDRFGTMEGKILDAVLEDQYGRPYSVLNGGENCQLKIYFSLPRLEERFLVGFIVKDRLGQFVLGTNTYDEYGYFNVTEAGVYGVVFNFDMPNLLSGEYTVTLSLARGDCLNFEQLCWVHDALEFSVRRHNDRGVMFYTKMRDVALLS
ncbi:ABC transporter, teichoic acids export ATP-binding protein [sediment metagenome]|uniref:ABC transporter, teichoic acids export ATP-binding protein n=1 Tax=sediment metagenome TaxID=749907 RepID=D9PKJ5_9ZZZZ